MADDLYSSTLPPDAPRPWLARNRKIVILLGAVMVIGLAAWLSTQFLRPSTTKQTNVNVVTGLTNSTATTTSRPTFQRSTITNTSTTLPPAYRPPSTEDLRKAITNLNTSSNTNH